MFQAIRRATLIYRDPVQEHLHIVMTDPHGPKSEILLAPVCTVRRSTSTADKSCLLNVGDHEFINHESYIAYAICRIEEASIVENRVAIGLFVDKGMLDTVVFDRVTEGFYSSKRIAPCYRNFLAEASA